MSHIYEIVVQVEESHAGSETCYPTPSTSRSVSTSPAENECNSGRNLSKQKSGSWSYLKDKRKTKRVPVKKVKSVKISSASRLRVLKNKIDKKFEKQLASRVEKIEQLEHERELLRSGRSRIAIMCNELTESARSLRNLYEKQQAAFYKSLFSRIL